MSNYICSWLEEHDEDDHNEDSDDTTNDDDGDESNDREVEEDADDEEKDDDDHEDDEDPDEDEDEGDSDYHTKTSSLRAHIVAVGSSTLTKLKRLHLESKRPKKRATSAVAFHRGGSTALNLKYVQKKGHANHSCK